MSRHACRGCSELEVDIVWQLVPAPYGDQFTLSKQEAVQLLKHPLDLGLCATCHLLQLVGDVNTRQIYANYLYQTSVTTELSDLYQQLALTLVDKAEIKKDDLVVDVGSNDGTFLQAFKRYGVRPFGIEPAAGPADAAIKRGVATLCAFLDDESTSQCLDVVGEAKLVSANFVWANIPKPKDFLRNLARLASADGLISIVTGYHPDQFAVNMFEYINHDHLSYFTVAYVSELARELHLELVSANRLETKGGSIHFVLRKEPKSVRVPSGVRQLIQREMWMGSAESSTYFALAKRIDLIAEQFRYILNALPEGKLVGVGASISTTHLLYQFGLGDYIRVLLDDDPRKHGRYSPGIGIQVQPLDSEWVSREATIVLLAWQHTLTLMDRLKKLDFPGQVALPLPNPKLLVHF